MSHPDGTFMIACMQLSRATCTEDSPLAHTNLTGGETEAKAHTAGYAVSGFLRESFSLASWP